jgi:hypothetical protein
MLACRDISHVSSWHLMTFTARPERPGPVLWLLVLVWGSAGCIWLDDFGKFKIGDAGVVAPDASDAQSGDTHQDAHAPGAADAAEDARTPEVDAQPDTGSEREAGGRCRRVDCTALDSECSHGVCDPKTGECSAMPRSEGDSCFDGNPCSQNDRCREGRCVGQQIDCSEYDDDCSQGVCDPTVGGCTYGPTRMSLACDDANPCTLNDRCGDSGCIGGMPAPTTMTCNDYNDCTGTSAMPDHCSGEGRCLEGADVAAGTNCNDDSECTAADSCDGNGACTGMAVREGERCQTKCTANTRCKAGVCQPDANAVPDHDPRCVLNLCGEESLCRPEWEHDRVCHCGCSFNDPDCNECSAQMCLSDAPLSHSAQRWCNGNGSAIDNCPDSLKGNGRCDCGCQFVDPDCSGGACCSATGRAGCDNAFVENCVCQHPTDADASCCTGAWTARCATLAVGLGCMICP